MPEAQGSESQASSQPRNQHRGRYRGRTGRNRPQAEGSSSPDGSAPGPSRTEASPFPASSSTAEAKVQKSPRSDHQGSRAPRRGGGGGRRTCGQRQTRPGGHDSRAPKPPARRAFGGHLTSGATDSDDGPSAVIAGLSADAPEFIPGQPVVARSSKPLKPKALVHPKIKPPKSTAGDLGTRIHQDIGNLNYECAICTDDVSRSSHVWSCALCWTVVHIKCAERWYEKQKKQPDLQPPESQREVTWRETDYENGWSCDEICGDLLPCGEHSCPKACHSGFCGDCGMTVQAKCYCGRTVKQIPCSEQEEPRPSFDKVVKSWFEGVFTCNQVCQRSFDCGVHKCSKTCHPQEEQPAHCPFSPDSVTHCPCGKTPLESLVDQPRTSCEDFVPHCREPCHKKLPCGHLCPSKCHTGDCGSCYETIDVPCVCGRTSSRSLCHQGRIERPMCTRICQANLGCGRHKCGEHCCPGEKKAAERQAARKKHKRPEDAASVEAEHICIRTCGRLLKCGTHHCQQMCHRGPCASCPEAIFTEISCDCGRTVLQPPQPCGTRPPDCRFHCLRLPGCGHPAVEHSCHPDGVSCPKCPFLVEKWCACGKEKLHSQPCHLQEPRCGKVCGKRLSCGLHNCAKLCHKPGDCEDAGPSPKHCEQPCGKAKLFCEHPCRNTCHGQSPCNESSACTAKAVLRCPCGLRQQELKCLASSSNPAPSRPDIKCDDECLRLERNRRLAAALNINPASHQSDHVPYSDTTLGLFRENPQWAEAQEREFRVFASSPNEVRLRYKPMAPALRQFLHALADDYGLESRSEDVEPHRYVVVFKGARFVSAPTKTLAQSAGTREKQAAAASRAPSPPPPPPPAAPQAADPFNSFLLTSPRFGLTIDDVRAALHSDLAAQPSVRFDISFLPSEHVLLRAVPSYSAFLAPTALHQALASIKPRLRESVQAARLAAAVVLCHADPSGTVTRRDDANTARAAGWSAVASRAASKATTSAAGPAQEPASGAGRRLVGLRRKKKIDRQEPWASQLDGEVEC
ncbi:uncharacterized protein UV8b_02012 [Ustilaginoidea virens]|uniref:R3H domain-containing protein n=1 Tax=Ustilaginoidea virens TaxID=1159556 RepID=A0A8E5HLR0_USTVR|nr:uncharacterized protein UV8b_02012 [Ustilaginoidea virens]QUC17771.1 hypothetical protein UV8b_02012 [Ustilaginoidea virens]